MTEKAGAERRIGELCALRRELVHMKRRYLHANFTKEPHYALFGALDAALLIAEGAIRRTESMGAHFLVDEKSSDCRAD